MKNTEVTSYRLRQRMISKYHYTISLLQEAFQLKLIDRDEISRIQQGILAILRDLIREYNDGQNSSIRTEKAESIQQSILYTIDTCLTNEPGPEEALELLLKDTIKNIYHRGSDTLKTTLRETEKLYEKVLQNQLNIPLEVYQSSIEIALPQFFQNYDPIFSAQDTMTMLDYPLVFDDMKIEGVFYIKNYLEHLQLETRFCAYFSTGEITALLENYGQVYKIDYRHSPLNIFEVLSNNVIFNTIAGNSVRPAISQPQGLILRERLTGATRGKLSFLLKEAVDKIIRKFSIQDKELIKYINCYQQNLLPRLKNAADNNSLQNIIITDNTKRRENTSENVTYFPSKGVGDRRFKMLINKLRDAGNIQEKLALIKSTISSRRDFIDILEADCLFNEEFTILFEELDVLDLAVLSKAIFTDELRSGQLKLSIDLLRSRLETDAETDWEGKLIKYLLKLNESELLLIEQKLMQLSEIG